MIQLIKKLSCLLLFFYIFQTHCKVTKMVRNAIESQCDYDWIMQYLDAKLFDLIRILLLLILQIILANICTFGQISIIFFEFVSQSWHYRPLFRKISANRVFFFCLFIVETEVLIVLHALFNIDLLLFI